MITYELQCVERISDDGCRLMTPFAPFEVQSPVLPRVGDGIEVDDVAYDVIAVWHVVNKGSPGSVREFVVRVQ